MLSTVFELRELYILCLNGRCLVIVSERQEMQFCLMQICLLVEAIRLTHLAGATLTGSEITVEGCGSDSLQGDVQFAKVMEAMGAKLEWAPTSIKIKGETC